MNSIGVTFNSEFLAGKPNNEGDTELMKQCGTPENLLHSLKSSGVDYIEIHNAYPDCDRRILASALGLVLSGGMKLSIHGSLINTAGQSFFDIYPAAGQILDMLPQTQDNLIMTVHAYSSDLSSVSTLSRETIKTLNDWTELIERDGFPIRIAVELNRVQSRFDPSNQCSSLINMVDSIGSDRVGICWDMGHYQANFRNGKAEEEPGGEFLSRVIHTHIHGIGGGRTHHPVLLPDSGYLYNYLRLLKSLHYSGIFNLELEFSRFCKDIRPYSALFTSISSLKAMI